MGNGHNGSDARPQGPTALSSGSIGTRPSSVKRRPALLAAAAGLVIAAVAVVWWLSSPGSGHRAHRTCDRAARAPAPPIRACSMRPATSPRACRQPSPRRSPARSSRCALRREWPSSRATSSPCWTARRWNVRSRSPSCPARVGAQLASRAPSAARRGRDQPASHPGSGRSQRQEPVTSSTRTRQRLTLSKPALRLAIGT